MSKQIRIGAAICIFAAISLTGCGQAGVPDTVDATSIIISDKGAVTSCLVGAFDKDYYDISDLTAMAVSEAAEYNTAYSTGDTIAVAVEKVEALDDGSGRVVVTYQYDSTGTFMNFSEIKFRNESILFYGTVEEAVKEGYDLNVVLKNVKDSTLLSKEQLLQEAGRYLLITNEKAVIYCPKKVTHVTEGAVYGQDGSVDASQAEDMVVILMK